MSVCGIPRAVRGQMRGTEQDPSGAQEHGALLGLCAQMVGAEGAALLRGKLRKDRSWPPVQRKRNISRNRQS